LVQISGLWGNTGTIEHTLLKVYNVATAEPRVQYGRQRCSHPRQRYFREVWRREGAVTEMTLEQKTVVLARDSGGNTVDTNDQKHYVTEVRAPKISVAVFLLIHMT
jgi:hypothetical protein